MSTELTEAEQAKFAVLARGISVSDAARSAFRAVTDDGTMTPADYASTSGLILRLPDDVWVNAPFASHNPNFVLDPAFDLTHDPDGFALRSPDISLPVSVWVPPAYHGGVNGHGRPWNHFVVSHGDRARISPVQGCAMTCKFCDIPYERTPYGLKEPEVTLEAARVALADPRQPARHVLVSGGTPRDTDVAALAAFYETVLTGLAGTDVDIMMVPIPGLLDVEHLARLGARQLSVNLEVFNLERARSLMPQKYRQGRSTYLDFIEAAVATGRLGVRSMLMVGLEPVPDTLAGVAALVERGATPVLSPFRPDPLTPLRDDPPPREDTLVEVFLRATEIAEAAGIELGPDCPTCTHNTITLRRGADYPYPLPLMV